MPDTKWMLEMLKMINVNLLKFDKEYLFCVKFRHEAWKIYLEENEELRVYWEYIRDEIKSDDLNLSMR